MKARVAVVLIQDGKIALLERHKLGSHYYVFPGGKVKRDETLTEAAAREAQEELGLVVEIGRLAAEIWYLGSPQYYFFARPTGGQFGHGMGPEMGSSIDSSKGSYLPVWLDIASLSAQPVYPKLLAEHILKNNASGWSGHPLVVKNQPPENIDWE